MSIDRDYLLTYVKQHHKLPLYKALPSQPNEYENWNELDIEFDIWKTQVKFLKDMKRINYNLEEETLVDIVKRIDNEDEKQIDVRIELWKKDEWNLPDIWTRYGKLDKICIMKPEKEEDFRDLSKWIVAMLFMRQQNNVIEYDVCEAYRQFDHIIAWYAMWRKWPIQYTVWEWAASLMKKLDTEAKFLDYGHNGVYQRWWQWAEERIEWLPTNISDEELNDEDHCCPWEEKLYNSSGTSYIPKIKRRRMDDF
jgi:hypothetical protein